MDFELETDLEVFYSETDIESVKEDETKLAVEEETGFELEELEPDQADSDQVLDEDEIELEIKIIDDD